MSKPTLYEAVTIIAEDYFGPAAPRFISRIITSHLKKAPSQVRPKDMPELITWVKVTVALVTDDTNAIEEFVARLKRLSEK